MPENHLADANDVAQSLSELTAGWSPALSVDPATLTAARAALASSVLAAYPGVNLQSPRLAAHSAVAAPALKAELLEISQRARDAAAQGPVTTIAVVRSPSGADPSNPAGVPDWARGGRVVDGYGPFQDATGALHWVDLLPGTASTPVQYAGAAAPFAVVPVQREIILPPPPPNELELGTGSVWFLASLLGTAFDAGAFTGFTITGGTLLSTQPFTFADGVYQVSAGAALTLTVSLAPATQTTTGAVAGPDAAAATATPPAELVIAFTQASAIMQMVADAQAQAYGSSITLHWTGVAPVPSATGPAEVLIPCSASPASFGFIQSASTIFTPSGSAAITGAAWALPLAVTGIATLPEAAGPGVCELQLGRGAELSTGLDGGTPVPVASWLLQIGTGTLLAEAASAAQAPAGTTLTLWPERAPATRTATIEFDTATASAFGFQASAASELLIVTGDLTAHLDRPLDASGLRIPFRTTGTNAFVLVQHTQASTLGLVSGTQTAQGLSGLSLVLENALLRTSAPTTLTVAGPLQADQFGSCTAKVVFPLQWALPTLPDPYATTFSASQVAASGSASGTALATVTSWDGTNAPVLSCTLLTGSSGQQPTLSLPAVASGDAADAAPATDLTSRLAPLALLDLSTNVDLLGVAIAPLISEYATDGPESDAGGILQELLGATAPTASADVQAPGYALEGMSLALNSADIATFALPQVSWEPMESTGPQGPLGPIGNPGSDGPPLLVAAPDSQQLVPFAPAPVLTSNMGNVAAGVPFAALFSLPFGLTAAISQPNGPASPPAGPTFLAGGGTFASLSPGFQPTTSEQLSAAVSLTLTPAGPKGTGGPDPLFPGMTIVDVAYGTQVLGETPDGSSSVESIFVGDFGSGKQHGVPLERADLSGYGASIFSEWLQPPENNTSIIKVQFEATRGRTAYEVIQAQSVIRPHSVLAVRTVTMQRQNAGWVNRTDSGWQPCSSGRFQLPGQVVHTGAMLGVFNVRNIREQGAQVQCDGVTYQPVLFDADVGVAASVNVTAGAFTAVPAFETEQLTLVPSRDLVGYLQLTVDTVPTPGQQAALVEQFGPFTPAVSCTVEAGKFGSGAGTVLRCSAFEIAAVTTGQGGNPNPELGVALRGAPQIPRGGGWSLGVRRYTDQAPTALQNDFPVPVVQNNNDTSTWHIADVADVDSLQQPASYYSLLHATGTNQVLFEAPQIPAAAGPGPGSAPGLQFPQLPSALPGGIVNPGSPNLGDLAAILNSTGLFPELSAALSLLTQNELPQINTTPSGFAYSKSYTFPGDGAGNPATTTIVDLGVITITLAYGDTTQPQPTLAQLDYTVDSSASPSWTLSLKTLSFQVTVPAFGSRPVLTITGGFYGDENTKPGLTNLNVTFGSALSAMQSVFSDMQALAAYLPGGVGADLDVAVSDGKLTVSDTFSIADLPLGLGQLTDISLELGLQVALSPLSVDFLVGLGAPDNPFSWIASPLAGNGLMNFGVQKSLPAFVIQAGIGLGLAIDLGIASGSASITIAVELDVTTGSITVIATLTGQASVDVLDGLASASLTLSAGLGFEVAPPPTPQISPPTVEIPAVDVTLLATCSVGIHLSICWVVSVSWDGSWEFQQTFHTPALSVTA